MHLLLDTASLYYRSYYALPESMTAPDGFPHNAVRGFLSTLARLITTYRTTEIACAWDEDWRPDWRVRLLPTYKTHRVTEASGGETEETPETLGPQVDAIARLLDAMGIARPGAAGFEADDVVGTLAATLPGDIVVVSGDRDLVQLVDERVRLLLTVNGGMDKWPLLAPQDVYERFGVEPHRYVELAVLRGDPSDGIPGIPGIGAKTAASLVQAFGSMDDILVAAADVRPPMTAKRATAICEGADYLAAAMQVARVVRDVPLTYDVQSDEAALDAISREWGVERQVSEVVKALEAVRD